MPPRTPSTSSRATTPPSSPAAGGGPASPRAGKADHLSQPPEHLDPQALNGSNRLRLAVFSNPRENQILLAAVFDNLGKGASGAAVQNLDLMLGRH